jgi:transcriptional regulator with XRE-family HTH domain
MADENGTPSQDADHIPDLARELRQVRVATGMSLKELERTTASSDSSLSRYLAGTSVPPWAVVEALCLAAKRDPQDLMPLWQAAQRVRVARRGLTGPGAEQAGELAGSALDSTGQAPGRPALSRRPRRLLLAAAVCCAAVLAAIVLTVQLMPHVSRQTPAGGRVCPWHYVVTDGDPAPVLIANSPAANRKHIGLYEPNQVFYVSQPPVVRNGMIETLDGWVTFGNWIQRYQAPCLNRSDVPSSSSSSS